MAQYDGSVVIKTDIDTKGANSQLSALENRMVKTADKIASLRSKMDSLKDTKIPTTEYTEVQKQIEETAAKIDKLKARQEEFLATGGKEDSTTFKKMQYELSELENSMPYLKAELQDLVDSGKAFTLGQDTEEFAKLGQDLSYAENDMAVLNQKHDELIAKQNQVAKSSQKMGDTAKKSFEKMSKSASKSAKDVSASFKGMMKNILKYGLGIRSLYVLVNKLRTAIKEGFTNLYNANVNSFKSQVDGLKASLLTLKNSFAAAFSPIVQAAILYLQQLISWLTAATNAFGQFIAALMGQKTYTKAVKQTAGALEDEAGAAKSANKQLSGLDKLNNLTSNDSSGGGSSTDTSDMFEEVPIDSGALDFLDSILDYLNKLKDIFTEGFWDGLGDWEYRWDSIKDSIASIKESLKDIFTDPAVLAAADSWAQSVAYMLGSLRGSAASIGLTIAANLYGGMAQYLEENSGRIKEYLISMFDIWADINTLLSGLFQSIAYVFEAFASENGTTLTANLIGIFTDAFMGVTEIVSKLIRDIMNIFIQPFVDNKEEFRAALEGFLGVLSDVTGTIKQGIDDTFDKLNEVYDEHFKPFFDSVAQGLSDLVGSFLEFWNGNVQPILDKWAAKFDDLWKTHIQPMIDNAIELLGKLADFLKVIWEEILQPLIQWIIDNVLPVILPIIDGLVDGIMEFAGYIADAMSGVMEILGGVIDFLVGVFTGDWDKAWKGISKIVEGVKDTLKGVINSILGFVEKLANGVVSAINTVIRALNRLKISIPNWVPELGGKSFGFNIPELSKVSIPRLAQGTVIPTGMKEYLAVLGDNNKETEVVSPLSTIEQAVRNALNGIGGIGGNVTITCPIYLDRRQIGKAMKEYSREELKRTGSPAFAY